MSETTEFPPVVIHALWDLRSGSILWPGTLGWMMSSNNEKKKIVADLLAADEILRSAGEDVPELEPAWLDTIEYVNSLEPSDKTHAVSMG